MKKVISLYKPVSYTPLQVVELFRRANPEYEKEKLGYAGRLDPMASGVLIVLVGDENGRRKEYERLAKVYEFEVLFGVKTDTYDVMGRILEARSVVITRAEVERGLFSFVGRWRQEYPPYSSILVRGKPLYWWARAGRLAEIDMPSKEVEVEKIDILSLGKQTSLEVVRDVQARVEKTEGEFRQEEIVSDWELLPKRVQELPIVRVRIECSSGVYVRGIANMLGKRLGVPALAYSICRTRVGAYDLSSTLYLDSIDE